ncbi:MAG: aminomethyl-transferring glycine dehydrogenase subunit GcvPA, partial [Gammaproteobacteria bacterium]|nr:aminomethyl-transferring glycine dehydrogenase subunit GcvPA [Gammaproteobacteria bacterium]
MPFIPHTSEDTSAMLDFLGIPSIDRLFDEIPDNIRAKSLSGLPEGIGEMALMQLMESRARQDEGYACFIGAGAYEHHIPAAVWDIVSRGEFLTAYTPYQAEASQGTLQLIYEFQSMMAHLTAMDVANASVYDGASALAEAVLMAVRSNKKSSSRRVLCAGNLHPSYISACDSIVSNQEIELVSLGWNRETGTIDSALLAPHEKEDYAALIVSNPSFFGTLEDVNQLTDWAHARDILVIAVVNPTSLALLVPPGHWGSGSDAGADIAVGEGQPLGIPLASGGPYLGFMCCKQALVRQMPGRIIGRTEDIEGHTGYALTLQAREQHIRRAKATSNICTNQGLLVTAATIYMSLMGASGLKAVAAACHNGLRRLVEQVTAIPGVTERFQSPCFHEAV